VTYIRVTKHDAVRSLKERLERMFKRSGALLRYKGRELLDGRTLKDFGIKAYCEVHLEWRLFQIKIQTVAGKTMRLDVEQSDTVKMVKEKLEEKEGIPVEGQHLIFGVEELQDDCTLRECRIGDKAKLTLYPAPALDSARPDFSALDVPLDETILITLERTEHDPSPQQLEDRIVLREGGEGGTEVPGSTTSDHASRTVMFTPSHPLRPATTYHIRFRRRIAPVSQVACCHAAERPPQSSPPRRCGVVQMSFSWEWTFVTVNPREPLRRLTSGNQADDGAANIVMESRVGGHPSSDSLRPAELDSR
jgi:ubiquitin-large subunit ribosomal protein L40e